MCSQILEQDERYQLKRINHIVSRVEQNNVTQRTNIY